MMRLLSAMVLNCFEFVLFPTHVFVVLLVRYTSCMFDGLQNDTVTLRGAEAYKPRCCGHVHVVK